MVLRKDISWSLKYANFLTCFLSLSKRSVLQNPDHSSLVVTQATVSTPGGFRLQQREESTRLYLYLSGTHYETRVVFSNRKMATSSMPFALKAYWLPLLLLSASIVFQLFVIPLSFPHSHYDGNSPTNYFGR